MLYKVFICTHRLIFYIFSRRDKEFCHECRFCCTLSICTDKDGTTFKNSENYEENVNRDGKIDARYNYRTDQRLYKKSDYRCMKPSNRTKPEKWSYYDMEGFRAAKTKDELKKVKEVKYDKYFFNFEDPEVFKKLMHSKKGPRKWRRTYGYDFAYLQSNHKQPVMNYECLKYCYKAERKRFAKNCKKKGGFFKCCLSK